jgi:hypothetical protein
MHLVGLSVSRAWCLAGVADALAGREGPAAPRLREPLDAAARRHAAAGAVDVLTDHYAGPYWLSPFALSRRGTRTASRRTPLRPSESFDVVDVKRVVETGSSTLKEAAPAAE